MSSAVISSVAVIGPSLAGDHLGYQPASGGSERLSRSNYLQGSASDWMTTIKPALELIHDECATPNWDGLGARGIRPEVIAIAGQVATALFELLQAGTPAPDVVPEADGEISLNWTSDATRTFSVSLGAQGKANFAGQFGREGARHGWKPIDISSPGALRCSLEEIASYVEKLYPAVVSRRAA